MSKVYEVNVRFMRRAQMKEYEPAEAEVTLKATVDDGEDYKAVASDLMTTAKTTAIESGLKSGKTAESATAAPAAEAPKNVGGRPKKQELTPPAETKPAAAAAPKEEPKAAAPAPAAEPDEFGEFDTPAAEPEKPMTGKELQEWITSKLAAKVIDTSTVKAIVGKYAPRTLDTKEEDRPKIKAEIEAACKK